LISLAQVFEQKSYIRDVHDIHYVHPYPANSSPP
jgi:hypothetical protein